MRLSPWAVAAAGLAWASLSNAIEVKIVRPSDPQTRFVTESRLTKSSQDQSLTNNVKCEGMYSKNSWGGTEDPYIDVKFVPYEPKDDNDKTEPVIATVIFDWADEHLLGAFAPNDPDYVCSFFA